MYQAKDGWPTFYRSTELGQRVVKMEVRQYERTCRLHNLSIRYPIVLMPRQRVDWRRVRLRNWSKLIGSEMGLSVEAHLDVREPNIVVHGETLHGEDPHELMMRGTDLCNRVARQLEGKLGMKLGVPSLHRKPHFGIYDPHAERFTRNFELSDDVGKMDRSEGVGELDYYDPNAAKDYLTMGSRIHRLEGLQTQFWGALSEYGEHLKTHTAVMKQIRGFLHQFETPESKPLDRRETYVG